MESLLVLLRKIIQNLAIRQKDDCVSFQRRNRSANRPAQRLFNSLGHSFSVGTPLGFWAG